jgi:hypothetical protein
MRKELVSLGVAISFGASYSAMGSESEVHPVSGCIFILRSNDTSAQQPGYRGQRLIVSAQLTPWKDFDVATHRGEATFTHLGKEWSIESEFTFRRLDDGFRYERHLEVAVNGEKLTVPTAVHGNERTYQEGYVFHTDAGLKFLDLNEITKDNRWSEVRSGVFSLFTFCTPRFDEAPRSDTIRM